jgi:dihydroflavonol-4-reductase
MRVLLTGGTGFIGAAVARELVAQGHAVRGLVRKTSKTELLLAAGAETIIGDVGDRSSLDSALEGIDGVIHLAGVTKARSTREYFAVNGDGTRAIAEACAARTTPPRLLLVSSIAAGGPSTPDHPRREDEPPCPISNYGRSKLQGEQAVRALATRVPSIIARPPIVFGPRDTDFFEVYKMARLGVVIRAGSASKRFSMVHVDDLARGLVLALSSKAVVAADGTGGTFHLADPGAYTWDALAELVARSMGKRIRVLGVPELFAFAAGLGAEVQARILGKPQILSLDKAREVRGASWSCDTTRAQTELGFTPAFALSDRIDQTTAWYRANGWLR